MSHIYGMSAKVKTDLSTPAKNLSNVTFGSYVRPLDGTLKGRVCIWTLSLELIPLSKPGELESRTLTGLSSSDTLVEVLPKDTVITVEIE